MLLTSLVPDILCDLPNEQAAAGEAWVTLRYGRHPHGQGMQVFERADALALANEFAGSLKARTIGLPWYIGHPDHPAFADRDRDGRAYGRVKELAVGDDGLRLRVRFGRAGRELANDEAFDGWSPNWRCVFEGGVFRPRSLKSVGWTNSPNIPVDPVRLANAAPQPSPTMNKLRDHLIALGILQPGAAEAASEDACIALANEVQDLRGKAARLAELEAQLANSTTAAATAATEAQERIAALQADLANERQYHAGVLVDAAIVDGRVLTGQRDAAIATLANAADFAAAAAELEARERQLPNAQRQSAGAETVCPLSSRAGGDGRAPRGEEPLGLENTIAGASFDEQCDLLRLLLRQVRVHPLDPERNRFRGIRIPGALKYKVRGSR